MLFPFCLWCICKGQLEQLWKDSLHNIIHYAGSHWSNSDDIDLKKGQYNSKQQNVHVIVGVITVVAHKPCSKQQTCGWFPLVQINTFIGNKDILFAADLTSTHGERGVHVYTKTEWNNVHVLHHYAFCLYSHILVYILMCVYISVC